MRYFGILFFSATLFAQGIVPNRYIVELSTEPVAAHAAHLTNRNLGGAEAMRHRALLRAEQAAARAAILGAAGRVRGNLETVANALLVEIPDSRAAALRAIPGVRHVHPVREFEMLLDRALPLHRVPQAWAQAGADRAGAGIKIALIDSGIDIGHPGFQDSSLPMPNGFPLADSEDDLAFTSNKVIVARSYADLFENTDPDASARDHVGHGTAIAMAAAGVINTGPLASISGVAPKAWLGSYKVFGTPGVNDLASEDAILKAIDDAVADGMDVISLSLGSSIPTRVSEDPEAEALENAASLGVIVVAAAGNYGPDPATISTPAFAPSVIAVGASNNDRMFAASVVISGSDPLVAIPGSGPAPSGTITGPVTDVSKLDGTGLACDALPAQSLSASIALIARGTCTFETKLNNAAIAGAIGAIVFTSATQPELVTMSVGSATLPAEMVSYQDGTKLQQKATAGVTATLQFSLGPVSVDPNRLATFSAKGPNPDFSIKPDLVAVGVNLYTAAQSSDRKEAVYDASGYAVEQGTSFSAPLVAGAAALLKAARPGLTAAQYRSLLVDTATPASLSPGVPAGVQQAGAGLLDLSAALNATAAAAPVSLSFGAGPPDVNASQILTISNIGATSDTFVLGVRATGDGPGPQLPSGPVQLAAGASINIPVKFSASALAPGHYEGYITIQGSASSTTTRVPYWYAVASDQPRYITVLSSGTVGSGGSKAGVAIFRISDDSGLPAQGAMPSGTVISGDATVLDLEPIDDDVPNAFALIVSLGIRPGTSVVRIQAGGVTKDVTFTP